MGRPMLMEYSPQVEKTAPALILQLSYLGMSVFWNLVNVGLIEAGQQPLGPVGSLKMVALMITLAFVLVASVKRHVWLYAGTSLLLALGAMSTIYSSFTGAPDNWPSLFFRIFGALINIVGLFGCVLACQSVLRSRRACRVTNSPSDISDNR